MSHLLHLGVGWNHRTLVMASTDRSLPSSLRPYQWEGVHFLLDKGSVLLADEMGLGKTVQVAVALSLRLRKSRLRRSLVVVPASLRLNWARELSRWAPDVSVGVVRGGFEDRRAYYMLPYNVLIVSYEQVRADLHSLSSTEFDVVVLDEAQRIKNPNAETALACRVLRRDASWALTGTPLENQVGDLVAVYRFVCPGLITSAMSQSEMHTKMQPFFLRRRKFDVLHQLPPIQVQDVYLELEGQQKQVYDVLWESRLNLPSSGAGNNYTSSMLALITRLKQACNFEPITDESAKLEALNLIVEGLESHDHKLLVFSQYVKTLQWLLGKLADTVSIDIIHGGLSESAKDRAVSRFNSEPGPRVLLTSLKAGGVGLNLGTASHVVLFDRWWNPAVEQQAIHRAHRFERSRVLHVFQFQVVDSIEDRIATILGEKRQMFEEYVEAADSSTVPPFSRWELENILDLSQKDTTIPTS